VEKETLGMHRLAMTNGRRTLSGLISPPTAATVLLWSAALLVLAIVDRRVPVFPFAVAGYAIYLGAVGAWLLPKAEPPDRVLCAEASGLRLAARCAVVLIAVAFVFTDDIAAALPSRVSTVVLTPCLTWVRTIRLAPGLGGREFFNFCMYAFLPGGLLLVLGARREELGLCLPARQTILATLVCLVPVVSFIGWGVATRRLAPAALFWLLIHNFFSNGFSEEFMCRGMIFSHLRAFFNTGWAQFGQAVAFASLHFHPAGAEEQAAPWRSLAEDLALNLPVAIVFGFLALRSRSLVLPTLLHLFRWLPWENG
jgi:membrane protease YdiL (CAAX protease family)